MTKNKRNQLLQAELDAAREQGGWRAGVLPGCACWAKSEAATCHVLNAASLLGAGPSQPLRRPPPGSRPCRGSAAPFART